MEYTESSFSNGNGRSCMDVAPYKENISTLQQRSFSSMSSYDSDSDLMKRMPILNTSYGTTLNDENCYCNNGANEPTSTLSGGDALMGDIGSTTGINSKSASLSRRSSKTSLKAFRGPASDVPDTVPTRTGKQKTLYDHDHEYNKLNDNGKKEDILKEQSHENLHVQNEAKKEPPKKICCTVFCALFKCKYIFTRYTIIDLALNLGSIAIYLFDFVTDWLNAIAYLWRLDEDKDNLFYFVLTAIVIVVPSIVIHFFSVWWEIEDNRHIKKEKQKNELKHRLGCCYYVWVIIFHLLQVAPVYRYMRTIRYGIKSRYYEVRQNENRWRFYDRKYKGELSDVNFIRLMESFLEAAPQLVLQIFIMIRTTKTPLITVVSVCVSLVGLSLSFVAYERALRNTLESKKQLSIFASIALLLYRTLIIMSRVLALALLLNTNVWAWIGFFLLRWFFMSALIAWKKTEFCSTKAKEYVYDLVVGFCYTFAYINVHMGSRNRFRMLAYYILMLLENAVIAVCWFYLRAGGSSLIDVLLGIQSPEEEQSEEGTLPPDVALGLVIAVGALYVLGMLFIFIYYLLLHPRAIGSQFCIRDEDDEETEHPVALRMRQPCGDNYRIHRGAAQFRSWHSASIHFIPEEAEATKNRKRPSSDIVSSSSPMLYDSLTQGRKGNLTADPCSCYSMRSNLEGATMTSSNGANPDPNRSSVTSYQMAMRNSPLRKMDFSAPLDGAKRQEKVELLVKQRREIEQRLNIAKMQSADYLRKNHKSNDLRSEFEITDLFNRGSRAQHIYSPRSFSTLGAITRTAASVALRIPQRKSTSGSELSSRRTNQASRNTPAKAFASTRAPDPERDNFNQSNRATRFVATGSSGTFPRTSRSARHVTSSSHHRQGSLKTIREDQSTHAFSAAAAAPNSASLMDISLSRRTKSHTVPRTMSYTISRDEVVEAIESSV